VSQPGWMECVSTAQADGPTLATFTTAVSCLPTPARYTIPSDSWFIGKSLHVKAAGRISNVVTAAPTFTFELRLGPTANIVAFTTGAIQMSTTVHTNVPFWLEIMLTCRSVGSVTAATLMGQAMFTSRAAIDVSGADVTTIGHPTLLQPETNPAVGTGFDSNVANFCDLYASCSASSASNGLTLTQYKLYIEN
jgi:hypothetical protein